MSSKPFAKPFAKPPQSLPHALAQSAPPLQHNGALGAPRGALGALAKGFAQGLRKGLTKGLTEGLTNHKNQKITNNPKITIYIKYKDKYMKYKNMQNI